MKFDVQHSIICCFIKIKLSINRYCSVFNTFMLVFHEKPISLSIKLLNTMRNNIYITWTQTRILVFILILPFRLYAQEIKVKEIPHIKQLPISVINTVFQDSEGYIWYGTDDGLCRDDGYNIHTFRSDFLNRDVVLRSNAITCLAEDSVSHHIWIGTNKGLYVLDKQFYTISAVDIEDIKDKIVEAIHIASDGTVWISSSQKILRLDKNGKMIKLYPLQCISGAGKEYVLYEDRQHQLLLSLSGKGLYKWNKEVDQFQLFFPYTDRVNGIIQDKVHDYYWLASWDHSIIRLDPTNVNERMRYLPQIKPVTVSGLTAKTALNIVQDDIFNYIWITSWSDLFVYRCTKDGMLERLDTSKFLPQRNKALKNITKDRKGNLWVTAADDNNFLISFDEDNIQSYSIKALEDRIKWIPTIVSLCKDEEGIFWFSQRRIGLCIYDAEKNKIGCYTDYKAAKDYPLLVVSCLLKSQHKGLVWVNGEYQNTILGLNQHDMEIEVCKEIDLSTVSDSPGLVMHLFEDKEQNLWIATAMSLFLYRVAEDKLETISKDYGNIIDMVQTKDGLIWGIQKNGGMISIDLNKKIEVYSEKDNLISIAATADGCLWLATSKGEILSFNPKTGIYENRSTACGMSGNKINDLLVDCFNHLWIVSSQEIKEFNPQNGAYRNFDASNENIKFTQFLPHSVYKDPNGELYFGGIPGILSVFPMQNMESVSGNIAPLITDVKVMGNSLFFNNERNLKSLNHVDICPDEQNLEIRFSSLDYRHTSQIRYAYRLSGIDKDWVYLPAGKNTAFYNKLSKSTYLFEVKATDKNGLWCNHITSLTIHRLPAFYETWWAYTIYFVLLIAVAYYIYRVARNRMRLRNELHLHKLEQAKAEEVNHAKLQFFTNITHELLTPLTILSAAVEELKQTAPAYKGQYKVMTNNINRLIRLLQQILEFRKAETGNLKLKVSKGDLALFVQRSVNSFLPLIKKKGMQFEVICQPNPFIAYFDSDKLDKIIYNLLSNAAKYNIPNETVRIELTRHPDKDDFVQLIVKDSGPGISREAQKELFKRFYEGSYRKFNTIGTGIGLSLVHDLVKLHHGTITVESEEGHGTAFVISFPLSKANYTIEEIDPDLLSETVNNAEQIVPMANEIEEDAEEEQAIAEKKRKKCNLLLVEDNEELLQLMTKLLSAEYNIHTAKDGKEGIESIKQHEIDLIVSDVMMPVMDGIEFCKFIKGNFDTSHIPIILLTAKKQEEDRVEAYESGADGFISKPFSLSVLHARIENLLSTRERMTKNFKKQLVFEAQELNYTSLDEEFLQKAIDCVHRHLDDPEFNQQQFIEELHTTRSTSFRKLKSLTGLNFPAFVNNIRMKAACRIMEEKKQMKVSEVAYAVGYNDPRYFTACFKKEIGMQPLEYMEKFVLK